MTSEFIMAFVAFDHFLKRHDIPDVLQPTVVLEFPNEAARQYYINHLTVDMRPMEYFSIPPRKQETTPTFHSGTIMGRPYELRVKPRSEPDFHRNQWDRW